MNTVKVVPDGSEGRQGITLWRLRVSFATTSGVHLFGGWHSAHQLTGDPYLVWMQSLPVIAKYLRRVYMCLYDLQKAFDSVEYHVLFEVRCGEY